MRKTKIICTLGPATDDENVLRALMLSGMDVARVNFSHQTHEEQKVRVEAVKYPGGIGASRCAAGRHKGA